MDALIVIFITGLISLFVGMLKKPYLTLGIIASGLVLSFCLQMNYGNYTSIFSKYDNLYFNITQL